MSPAVERLVATAMVLMAGGDCSGKALLPPVEAAIVAPENESIEKCPLGFAHVDIQVSDLDKARTFYHNVLGYEEVVDLRSGDSPAVAVAYFKINDRQFIELSPGLRSGQISRLTCVGMYTDDIEKLHKTLARRGLAPDPIRKGHDGNLTFSIHNPPGQEQPSLDFIQYMPGSLQSDAVGKALNGRRISCCVDHVGIVVTDLKTAVKFYVEKLGFRETKEKQRQDRTTYAVRLELPGSDGENIEMSSRPSTFDRSRAGIKEHLALAVSNSPASYQQASARGATLTPVKTSRGKQETFPFLLLDPDGTRIEFKQSNLKSPN